MVTSAAAASGPASTARALVVAAAPVLLLGALLWHPLLPGRLPDSAGAAEAAAADITRWGLSHLAAVVASAAIALAFVAVRGFLCERGDGWLSAVGLGFVVIGSTLYATLPGMEFSVVAAHATGADLVATQEALASWFVPVLLVGSLLFTVGTVLFAVAVTRTATFGLVATAVVGGALVVFGLARLVPVGVVQFYDSWPRQCWLCCRWRSRSGLGDGVPQPVDGRLVSARDGHRCARGRRNHADRRNRRSARLHRQLRRTEPPGLRRRLAPRIRQFLGRRQSRLDPEPQLRGFGFCVLLLACGRHRGIEPARLGWLGPALLVAVGCGLFTAAAFPLARDTTGEIYDPGLHWVDGLLFFGGSTLAFLVLSRRLAADPRWRSLSAYTLAVVVLSFGSTMALHLLARPTYAPLHDYGAWFSGQSSWC